SEAAGLKANPISPQPPPLHGLDIALCAIWTERGPGGEARPLHAHRALRVRGLLHGADDLIVAGAAAEVAGEPVADLVLVRVRVLLQQRLRRDDEARRADTALQRRLFQECLLQRM